MSFPLSILVLVLVIWLTRPGEERGAHRTQHLWWIVVPLVAVLALSWGTRFTPSAWEVSPRALRGQVLARRYRAVREARDAVLGEVAAERALKRLSIRGRAELVLVDSGVPRPAAAFIEAQVRREVTRLQLATEAQRVFITRPVSDSTRSEALRARRPLDITWLLPDSARAHCITIIRLNRDEVAQLQVALGTSLMGPCSFVARFGRPGPQIDRWLQGHAYSLAGYAAWDSADRPLFGRRTGLFPRQGLPARTAQCVMGDRAACREQLGLDASGARSPDREIVPVTFRDFSLVGDQLGHVERLFMSDLVLTLGPERFGAFWRSNDDVQAAFAATAGEDLSVYAARWLGRSYDATPGGPRVAPASLAALLLTIGLLTLVARRGLR
jgi:hypothetical protein